MRIVVAHESVETEGGAETYLVSVIQGLRERGHQIALVYYRRIDGGSPLRKGESPLLRKGESPLPSMKRTSRSALKIEASMLSVPISASGGPTSAFHTTWARSRSTAGCSPTGRL